MKTKFVAIFLVSVITGVLAWQITVQAHPLVGLPPELSKPGASEQSPETLALKLKNEFQNECAGLAVFAGLVAMVSGFYFSTRQKLPIRAVLVGVGTVLGVGTGFLMAMTNNYLQDLLLVGWSPSTKATLIWSALLIELAVTCCLVANIGLGFNQHSAQMWMGGIVGALLAAVVYPVLTGMLLQFENSNPALPLGFYSRALLFCLPTFLIFALMDFQYLQSVAKVSKLTDGESVG